jgi:mono/diheme cytochrome c family protein
MNKYKLSPRLIETLLGILATSLIATGILWYALQEPARIVSAQEGQILTDLDNGMTIYAENCSVCHGMAGEGIGATPALDNPALRSTDYNTLYKIIGRGLFGTSMPAWSKEDGGPLSDYQIGELVTLIQLGDWQTTQDRVVNMGLAPLVPFTTEPDPAILEELAGLPDGAILTQGITLYAGQCVACHGADGLGTSLAPALNDASVHEKTYEELERTILKGSPGTLMAPWENSLSDDEITALVTLITQWDQVPSGSIPAPDRPIPVTEESLALGAELYANNCSRCHAPEGQGTPRAPSLNVKGFLEETNDAAIQQIITLGVPGTSMPAWGDRMTDNEIQAIVGFIRSWEPTAPEVAEPARGGGGPWWQSEGNGSRSAGPPWLRSQNNISDGNQNLPSGGSNLQSQQTINQQPGSDNPNGNTIANGQQTGTDTLTPDAQSGENAQGRGAGGPPWAQPTQPTSLWEQYDWRVAVFLSAGLLISLVLMVSAMIGLQRLRPANQIHTS